MGIDRPDIEAEGLREVCPLFIDTPLVWADHPRYPSGGVGAWRSIGAATAVPADVARGITPDNGHSVNRVTGAS